LFEKKEKKAYNGMMCLLKNMRISFLFQKVFFLFLTVFLFAQSAHAQVFSCGDDCGADGGLQALLSFLPGTGLIQSDDIIAVTLGWVRFLLALLGTIAFVAFVWSGSLYVTAFASEENAEKAKKVMTWTSIGLVIILLSYAVVSTLIRATV
jgi:hypothetical protein